MEKLDVDEAKLLIEDKIEINHLMYKYSGSDYTINVFSHVFDDENDLKETYQLLNNNLALEFQSKLEKDIEKWNLYLFLFSKKNVSKHIKFEIENNKYATRKYVYGNLKDSELSGQREIIESKLFNISEIPAYEDNSFDEKYISSNNDINLILSQLEDKSDSEKRILIEEWVNLYVEDK